MESLSLHAGDPAFEACSQCDTCFFAGCVAAVLQYIIYESLVGRALDMR
jgi:hypothetical protein